MMNQFDAVLKRAKEIEGRMSFSLAFFEKETDAELFAELVKGEGRMYSGGWFHGMSCGREKKFDSEGYYAVSY